MLELKFTSFKKTTVDLRNDICVNIINGNTNLHIPILILSSSPVVNFPKEISLPDVAINSPTYSNIFVLNYTNNFYKFSFECRNEVKIIPDCKVIALKPGDGAIYRVELIPKLLGSFREKIHICFDGGKKIAIMLKCNVVPLNIFLSDDLIQFTPTYIGMMDTKSINIINNSEEMTLFELQPVECLHNSQCETNHPSKKFLQFSPQVRRNVSDFHALKKHPLLSRMVNFNRIPSQRSTWCLSLKTPMKTILKKIYQKKFLSPLPLNSHLTSTIIPHFKFMVKFLGRIFS